MVISKMEPTQTLGQNLLIIMNVVLLFLEQPQPMGDFGGAGFPPLSRILLHLWISLLVSKHVLLSYGPAFRITRAKHAVKQSTWCLRYMRGREQHHGKATFGRKELEPVKDGQFLLNFLNIWTITSEIRLASKERVHHVWGTLKLHRDKNAWETLVFKDWLLGFLK